MRELPTTHSRDDLKEDSDEDEGEGLGKTISDRGAVESLATVVESTSNPQA